MRGGILIIGSLLWDPDQGENKGIRKEWRKKRLKMDEKIHVFAPIRYGRKSTNGSYTMVFSKEIDSPASMGTAFVVPFKNEISTFKGLLNQAQYLSEAEGMNDKKLIKGKADKWCTIGILLNPDIDERSKSAISVKYLKQLNSDEYSRYFSDFKLGSEPSILKNNGEIDINWIRTVNPQLQKSINGLDFILATCPKPKIYPDSKEIKANLEADSRNYFYNNIMNGITTFQDKEILS